MRSTTPCSSNSIPPTPATLSDPHSLLYSSETDAAEAGGCGGETADSRVQPRHRRSNSASDRNLKLSRGGVLRPIEKEQDEFEVSASSGRTSRLQSPLHDNLNGTNKNIFSGHRASLEKDVSYRSMLSSYSYACSRRSLCVTYWREQWAEHQVLYHLDTDTLLVRNIFEHCVSQPPSEQNSSVASPAHTRHESRKHPSIISSAFCSSKKFPLRPLQTLISNNDLKNRIFGSSHAPLSSGNGKVNFGKNGSDSTTKVREKVSMAEKTPVLQTLKDHLHQCPSRLSEEMVKCMATVYFWLRSAKSANAKNSRSPLLSRSSTNAIQPRHGFVEERDFSRKSAVEISWIATRKRHSSHASYAIDNYRCI